MSAKAELLRLLRQSDTFISGEELSRQLGITRAAVWKNMELLREEGYTIESVTRKGYRLTGVPDSISEAEIRANLCGKGVFGCEIFSLPSVDSTNEEAKRQGDKGAPHGSVFVADEQTGGKGRLGRRWVSPPGSGLWFSILLRPDVLPGEVTGVTLLSAVAVCRGIRALAGCEAKIKWPNDVVIGTKKVCGILTELSAEMEQIHYLIPGIGVNTGNESFPPELADRATSLKIETGKDVCRAALLGKILEEFESLYERYGVSSFPEEYRELCVSIGRKVSLNRGGKKKTGIAVGLAEDGSLLIQTEDGEELSVSSGEVLVQGFYGEQI